MVVQGRWFPVSARLPGELVAWRRLYALAVDDGLYLFARPSDDADWFTAVRRWSPALPSTDQAAMVGWTAHTVTGDVVLTLERGGCRCGRMGHWNGPSWAQGG